MKHAAVTELGLAITSREYPAMRVTLQPKQKVYLEITPSSGPCTTQRLHYIMVEMLWRYRSVH